MTITRGLVGLCLAWLALTPAAVRAQEAEEILLSDVVAQATAEAQAPTDSLARVVWVQGLVFDAAVRWDVPSSLAWSVAVCESGGNPFARSPWGHRGLFQFSLPTWQQYAPRYAAPADFAAAYDPRHAAEVAMGMFANGEGTHWRSCTERF